MEIKRRDVIARARGRGEAVMRDQQMLNLLGGMVGRFEGDSTPKTQHKKNVLYSMKTDFAYLCNLL